MGVFHIFKIVQMAITVHSITKAAFNKFLSAYFLVPHLPVFKKRGLKSEFWMFNHFWNYENVTWN